MTQRQRTELRQTQRLALTLGLSASIRVLRQDASGLTLYLEEQAAENPWLRLDRPAPRPGDWLPRWSQAFAAPVPAGATSVAAADPSLIAHVLAEIERLVPRPLRAAAHLMAEALEPSGWLGRPLPALAAEAGLTLPEAERLLSLLQGMDPPGLFARGLAECLTLQCRDAGLLDPTMAVILGRLDLLAAGDLGRLARLAGVGEAEIALRQRRIRTLNPKPGAAFGAAAAPVREPDLIVQAQTDGGWTVALNRSALPAVSVAAADRRPARAEDQSLRQAARALCRQVEARSATLHRIGAEMLRRQPGLATRGPVALQPMTMAEVAGALGLHPGTVSRAVAGASVDMPSGTFWLRHLFSAALKPADDGNAGGPAAAALRARLARLVAAEDPAHPLGDAALARALAEGGIAPARRTVAKYRAALAIPPAHHRRQQRRPDGH
jgi:RNA polymerase sigma-54 factor